jgi:hypothetical protein
MKVNVYADEVANIKQVSLVRKSKDGKEFAGVSIGIHANTVTAGGVVFWTRTKTERKRLAQILEKAAAEIRKADVVKIK